MRATDSEQTTLKHLLKEDEQHWVLVPAKNGLPEYYEYTRPVEKNSLNDREYRIIRLANHLEATIVSDKHADRSAACMDVSTGYFHDPDDMPGTAHFCEHLMFMGSKRYEQENGYQQYLDLNSGDGNAWTAGSYTAFYFTVASDALEGALDHFSAFFYCPLFHKDSALHEVRVVNDEYSNALQKDAWRLQYLEKCLAHPGHPLRKFNHGSRATILGKRFTDIERSLDGELDRARKRALSVTKDEHGSRGRTASKSSVNSARSSKKVPKKSLTEDNHHNDASRSGSSTRRSHASVQTNSEARHTGGSRAPSRTPSRTPSQNSQSDRKAEKDAVATISVLSDALERAAYAAVLEARKKLIKWWEREYCASRMSLSVVGKESLDKLTHMVLKRFNQIENKGQDPAPFKSLERPYGKHELGKIIYAKTIIETYDITIAFPIHWQDPLWRESPTYFIAYLLGHEGPGSLHSYLKNKGWLQGLSAVCYDPDRGMKNHREVILTCFKFINLIRKSKFPEWMYKELKAIQELSFRFKDKDPALPHAVSIATESMKLPIPRAHLLNGPVLFWEWNEKIVRDTLKELDIENCYIIVAANEHNNIHEETWHKEQWCGAEYVKKQLESRFISEARKDNDIPGLTLPEPNPFLPENFDVHRVHVSEPKKRPALLERTSLVELWHKKDDQFWVPKAIVKISAQTPIAGLTSRASVLTRMFVNLVEDALNEYSFYAKMADVGYSLDETSSGFTLTVGGYNDKLHILAEAVLNKIRHLEIRKDRFRVMLERNLLSLKNMKFESPDTLSMRYLTYLRDDRIFSIEDREEALKSITIEELSKHAKALLSHLRFKVLVTGNLRREDALNIASLAKKTLLSKPLPEAELPKMRTRLLPKGCNYIWEMPLTNDKETSSSVSYYCHVGNLSDPHTRVTCFLLAHILDEPVFDILRTKEHLGYAVGSLAVLGTESIGWCLVIQSEMDLSYLESRIEAFLRYMRKIIRDISNETLEGHKTALEKGWMEKIKTVPQETKMFWTFIQSGYYDFQQNEKDTKLLQNISPAEVRKMFKENFDPSSETRSKLSIHVRSHVRPRVHENPASPSVSRHAAQELLIVLKEENVSVDEIAFNTICKVEPPVSEIQEFLKEKCLNEMIKGNNERVQELFRKLDLLVEKYPVKPALEVEHIQDGDKFRHGLALSGTAKPVEKLETE
ncbi:uncharacterized protein FOMMEDRAFT_160684 [Fomitiporia mediterranea MF3/22]|uniref:uncharacterized protein n=1 Tax=Fomitiporia mediterranea (strain MF3/22) TaxID=694068 RepID=UPI0004407E93|nr:uncharacterized protein FOMMEDRAFT_160684 [Fomitiporia mediterranea MF3/22]EJC99121.1 hypothetical protein FOMMEDRAFT_160684 [Fomitiporia mediterranea MF3/22]